MKSEPAELEEKIVKSEVEKFLKDYEFSRISSDVIVRVVTIIIGALGLIAALAWDDALRHLFQRIFGETGTLREKVIYAFAVTAAATIISVLLGRYVIKRRQKNEKSPR